ncbi:SEA (Seh1-associated) complex subunit, partial [Coemansia sp. RSA 2322]
MRPPVLSVFGTRARTSGSEQQGVPLGSGQTDSQEPRSGVAYSGPTDASGVYIPSSADTAEDVRNATATSRLHTSGKESTSGGQQPRAVPPQGAGPQGVWLHTSPGERSGGEGVIGGSGHLRPPQQQTQSRPARISTAPTQQELAGIEDAHVAKSSESISSGALQYSRESRQTGRTPAGTQQQQQQSHSEAKSSGSVDTLALLPAVSGSQTMSSGNRLTVGSDPALLGRGDIDAWRAENSETSDCDGVAPNQPHNPWSFVRSPNHKKTLTSNFPIAWSAIAASPDVEPICAVAGREGLHLLTMGPDHIVERISLTVGRRWTLAMHFNDVVWRPMDYIATGSHNGKVTIWDPARRNEQSVRTYGDVVRSVTRLTSKPGDPNFVYSAFSDGSIFGYDIRDASNSPALRLAFQSPQDIHCNPSDANYIASIAQEGRLSTWDIRMPTKAFLSFVAHSSTGGRCVAWHHNGRFIGSGGSGTDPVIRIWDVQKACEKAALEPSCEIKTSNSVHRLQWRPGYDTQISSCAFSTDPRLQIWDITNNHHNMLFHDKHIDKITGFVWYDENTVWSVGRDHQIIQCDMRSSDVVVTSKLFSNVAAEFSPSTHLAVATGVHCPRSSSASATEQLAAPHFDMEPHVKRALQNQYGNSSGGRGKAKRVASGSSRSGADSHVQEQSRSSRVASNELAYMAKFAFDLPRPSVDEHPLDPTLAVNSVAICKLARNYHYDPDAFVDCCMHNSGQALAVGFVEIAKFWLFLSAVFGDTLPLKAK